MKKLNCNLFLFCFFVFLSACTLNSGISVSTKTEEFMLPAVYREHQRENIFNLDTMVIRPDDNARHPMVIINHGVNGRTAKSTSPGDLRNVALEFVRRGWVAVLFTRRGFGKSEGVIAEKKVKYYTAVEYERIGRLAASDIKEVVRLMSEKDYVDPTRIISIGASSGGYATVALTADPPSGLIAAINISGGLAYDIGNSSVTVVPNESALVDAFGYYGKDSRVPMLWIYAVNDLHHGPEMVQLFYKAFNNNGGKSQLIEISSPPWGNSGHGIFLNPELWYEYVDKFLKELE